MDVKFHRKYMRGLSVWDPTITEVSSFWTGQEYKKNKVSGEKDSSQSYLSMGHKKEENLGKLSPVVAWIINKIFNEFKELVKSINKNVKCINLPSQIFFCLANACKKIREENNKEWFLFLRLRIIPF